MVVARPRAHFGNGKLTKGVLTVNAPDRATKPSRAPDVDKAARAILDGLTGVVYEDDKYVARLVVEKWFGRRPGAYITIQTLPAQDRLRAARYRKNPLRRTQAMATTETQQVEDLDCPDCNGTGILGSEGEKLIACERCGGHEDAPGTGKIPVTELAEEEAASVADDQHQSAEQSAQDDTDLAARVNREIVEANRVLKDAQAVVENQKIELAKARKDVELALKRLQATIDEPELPFADPEKPARTDEDAWREDPIEVLGEHGLRPGLVEKLNEAGLTRLGAAHDWLHAPGTDRTWLDVPGVGEASAAKIEDAWISYMEARAERLPIQTDDNSDDQTEDETEPEG